VHFLLQIFPIRSYSLLFSHLIFHLCLSKFFFVNAYRLFDVKPSGIQGKIDCVIISSLLNRFYFLKFSSKYVCYMYNILSLLITPLRHKYGVR
jgi:hypothetical protein